MVKDLTKREFSVEQSRIFFRRCELTHKFSQYLLLAMGVMGVSALPAVAATCASGQLGGTYTSGFDGNGVSTANGFSCTLDGGNITFSNFVYSSTGTGVGSNGVN